MTMCNYDLDAFSLFLTTSHHTTPLYSYLLPLFPFCLFLCTLIAASLLTAWPMTHSDGSGCTMSFVLLVSSLFHMTHDGTLAYTYLP